MNNTLLKGLGLLELLVRSERGMTMTQIAAASGLVKSNVHRLLQALVDTQFVMRDPDTGIYSASIKLWELGSSVLSRLDLRRIAEGPMDELMEKTGESVHLSILDGAEVVYVHKVDSLSPVRAYTQIGGRVPAHCVATGKSMLAHLGQASLERLSRRLQKFTPATIVEPEPFLKEMHRIRLRGYAVNRGEWREEVWGVAAPIRDAQGGAFASIGISGPAARMRRMDMTECAAVLIITATQVSERLGASPHLGALTQFGTSRQERSA